jgi:hypothetical protein
MYLQKDTPFFISRVRRSENISLLFSFSRGFYTRVLLKKYSPFPVKNWNAHAAPKVLEWGGRAYDEAHQKSNQAHSSSAAIWHKMM